MTDRATKLAVIALDLGIELDASASDAAVDALLEASMHAFMRSIFPQYVGDSWPPALLVGNETVH